MSIQAVIPMCGVGKRFQDAGFMLPKPMIDVAGKPMIVRAIESIKPFRAKADFFFIARSDHLEKGLWGILAPYGYAIEVSEPTQGAVDTIMQARELIDMDEPLLIANCDQIITADIDMFIMCAMLHDGMLMTFNSTNPHHSYAKVNKEDRVTEVAEKKVISDNAAAGIYFFKRSADFFEGADRMIEKNIRVNGEYYITPVYNELIAMGKDIRIFEIGVHEKHIIGTPEELQIFLDKVANETVVLN